MRNYIIIVSLFISSCCTPKIQIESLAQDSYPPIQGCSNYDLEFEYLYSYKPKNEDNDFRYEVYQILGNLNPSSTNAISFSAQLRNEDNIPNYDGDVYISYIDLANSYFKSYFDNLTNPKYYYNTNGTSYFDDGIIDQYMPLFLSNGSMVTQFPISSNKEIWGKIIFMKFGTNVAKEDIDLTANFYNAGLWDKGNATPTCNPETTRLFKLMKSNNKEYERGYIPRHKITNASINNQLLEIDNIVEDKMIGNIPSSLDIDYRVSHQYYNVIIQKLNPNQVEEVYMGPAAPTTYKLNIPEANLINNIYYQPLNQSPNISNPNTNQFRYFYNCDKIPENHIKIDLSILNPSVFQFQSGSYYAIYLYFLSDKQEMISNIKIVKAQ